MEKIELNLEQHPYYNREAFAYTSDDPKLKPFYEYQPDPEEIPRAIANKPFSQEKRDVLTAVLSRQYGAYNLDEHHPVSQNIKKLKSENAFTVTTGQQIHVMGGPLFVLYKALNAIATAKLLSSQYPDYLFVPVFWMASEDHDFEEIKSLKIYGKSFEWEGKNEGPVGEKNPSDLVDLVDDIKDLLDDSEANNKYLELFRQAYQNAPNFAEATREILHHLFGAKGLLILEPNDAELKASFTAHILADLVKVRNYEPLRYSTDELKKAGFKKQIGAQAYNFFYLKNGRRTKIKREGNEYLLGANWVPLDELENEIAAHPERFSPNVALRPIYQECILPNLIYIAGTSELKYWMQLKRVFEVNELPYPMLLLRRSAIILSEKTVKRAKGKSDHLEDFFLNPEELHAKFDHELRTDIGMVKDALKEMQNEIDDVEKRLSDLPLKRQPYGAYKGMKKSLEQIYRALDELKQDENDIPQTLAETLRLKTKFFTPENPQERTESIVAHFNSLEDILNLKSFDSFSKKLALLIT